MPEGDMNEPRAEASVADRLRAVDSVLALHELLSELAADDRTRWTRTQILHYLPARYHGQADAFFDGERLRPADDHPSAPSTVDLVALDEILRRIHEGTEEQSAAAERVQNDEPDVRVPRAREISALPPYDGPGSGHEAVAGMLRALRDEIQEVDARAPKRFHLKDGRCTDGSGGRFTYQFTWSSEPDPHLPGTLGLAGKSHMARVGERSADGEKRFSVIVDEYLGAQIESADFRVDPTFLLCLTHQQLLRQLEARRDAATDRVDRLLASPGPRMLSEVADAATAGLNDEQITAVRMSAAVDRAYVWGPPGTGKTTTLGALVGALVSAGKRVLVVSPYNVAVDAAALAAARRGLAPGTIVRVGRYSDDVKRAELDVDTQLERIAERNGTLREARQLLAAVGARFGDESTPPESVRACLDELGAFVVRSHASGRDPVILRVAGAITQLRRRFRDPEPELLSRARVIATTMALHLVSSLIREQRFDHVIVDEASVVRPPEAVVLSLLTNAPLTFFGDPRQLPPIVISRSSAARRWLARSPFALAGISRPADAVGACVLLEEQHRMAPPIRAVVSDLFYDGRLRDGERVPEQGHVLLVDTSRTEARATSRFVKLSTSKENQLHRAVVAEVVRSILRVEPDAGVLVVSPFVAQTRAFRREPATSRLVRGIRFETIHASQGSERDVVVIDLVLAGNLSRGGRSHMFDEDRNPHLGNLLNVALSRAKRRLVVVAHQQLLRSAYPGGLVEQLLRELGNGGRLVEVPRDLRCRALFDAALHNP